MRWQVLARVVKGIGVGALAATVWWAVAQSQATSPKGGFLELGAQVTGPVGTPTLYSTDDVSGSDQVRWTSYSQSRLAAPFDTDGELTLPPGQTWISGSLKSPLNTSIKWKVNGSWVSAEPANGTAVSAVAWTVKPLYTFEATPLPEIIDFQGTGDGLRVIPYADRLYVLNHVYSTSYTDDHPFGCRDATTGFACKGFEGGNQGLQLVAGTPIQGRSNLNVSIAPLEAVNYKSGELFVPVRNINDNAIHIACVNLTTTPHKACQSFHLGSASSAPYGLETNGDEYYAYSPENATLYCLNIVTKTRCGGMSTGAPAGGNAYSFDAKAIGSKLFWNDGSRTFCFDTDAGVRNSCQGWPSAGKSAPASRTHTHAGRDGLPNGVCTRDGQCFAVDGSSFSPSANYMAFINTYANDDQNCCGNRWSAFQGGKWWAAGSKWMGRTPAQQRVACFDFKKDASCDSFKPRIVQDFYPYTTRFDPTRPNCMMILGDGGLGDFVDVTTNGPCTGSLSGKVPDIDVVPAKSYACDATRSRVQAWGLVRLSPVMPWGGANGLSAVTVTLKDAAGKVLPAALNPVRNFAAGQYTLSIADIPYRDYPALKVGVDFQTPGAMPAVAGLGIDVTWDGDPAQVCVSTQMPAAPDCLMGASLTVKTRMLQTASGSHDETLTVSKTLSPGGLSSGYSAVATPTSARAVLSDLSARDPKTYVVQGRWALQHFSGDLWAFGLAPTGQIDSSSYLSAQTATTAAAARPMFTAPAGSGTQAVQPLAWASLSPAQQSALNLDLGGVADTKGPARVDYLRGADGGFRPRSGKTLGPVINSSPAMLLPAATVSLNERNYPGYGAYRAQTTRPFPIALFGGNDGALHAYEVRSGSLREAWSFVPDVMLRRAANYADPSIAGVRANPYFVDNIPMVGHVNTGGANGWRAVAVVTYGRGARAITALDVTQAELSKGAGVLFEYTNASDPELKDLGYIISQPVSSNAMVSQQMVQLAEGAGRRSAVLVGNGINSNDGHGGAAASGTGKAVLYAFYLDQGGAKRWQRWAVDELWAGAKSEPGLAENNGLSTPTPVDVDDDGRIDLVYAGDLQGNLWRFDVRNPAAPSVTRLFKTEAQQPITQAPFVSINPGATACGASDANDSAAAKRCWQVVFATGAPISPLIGSPNVATQSMYGVLDKGNGASVARASLTAIPFELNKIVNGVEYRALKPTTVNYKAGALGWVVDLQAYEHGVGAPRQQPTGLVMFSSIRPTTPDKAINVCIGPRSWLNEVDPLNGYSALVPFDTNGDGNIDGQDKLNPSSASPLAPAGMAVSGAQFGPPALLLAASNQAQQMSLLLPSLGQDTGQANSWSGGPGSGGNSPAPGSNSAALTHANPAKLGRMSWREKY